MDKSAFVGAVGPSPVLDPEGVLPTLVLGSSIQTLTLAMDPEGACDSLQPLSAMEPLEK